MDHTHGSRLFATRICSARCVAHAYMLGVAELVDLVWRPPLRAIICPQDPGVPLAWCRRAFVYMPKPTTRLPHRVTLRRVHSITAVSCAGQPNGSPRPRGAGRGSIVRAARVERGHLRGCVRGCVDAPRVRVCLLRVGCAAARGRHALRGLALLRQRCCRVASPRPTSSCDAGADRRATRALRLALLCVRRCPPEDREHLVARSTR